MMKLTVSDRHSGVLLYVYQGDFDKKKLQEASQTFIDAFDKGRNVVIATIMNDHSRSISSEEAKKRYEEYPFRKLTEENEAAYHQRGLDAIQWSIISQLTVKTEDELYRGIIDQL